uniref:NADH-ubiquinone oxidoreductase chain 6 n=1 Tax=Abantennarius coccineus TaxID=2919613 RepID=D3KRD1_9TELE|nr:NADH dehydrogenase subunit 6 [Abantennarius coccineus]
MAYLMFFLFWGWVIGLIVVASNPSPYFGAFGLVVAAGLGCAILACFGGSFLSLILFLVYLGGMLVVFAYSAALAAEPYPESLGSRFVLPCVFGYLVGVLLAYLMFCGSAHEVPFSGVEEIGAQFVWGGDTSGVALMYSFGGGLLVMSAWALLITLLVVLELTRGLGRGVVRAV